MENCSYEKVGLNLEATELRLGLPGSADEHDEKLSSCSYSSSSSSSVVIRSKKRSSPEESIDDEEELKSNKRTMISHHNDDQDKNVPPSKAQVVVGWPPIRSYRKNNGVQQQQQEQKKKGEEVYVKVSMAGAPYLRKIDLNFYNTYQQLLLALENMFNCTFGEYSEREGYNGSEFAPTYEDKDGDWMLVGDVPWNMFISSCKRLRIVKGSEAKGLGCL
ncbi:hypothetical protein HN51_021506 [Arachis hypogaea]|uniref:Auxin-induced protein n=2 Tax=Arachis TaxID=3817 RepID=A0A445EG22_ARAHY|nr:auxin-induced protein 22D [Arachis duranensis]XP_025643327.1 auxin-induced protein 22D [Arachis hypogaea]QHO52592.1 Auxin-induced proteinD [Arachis hypogaea]RYR74225.1 hypothetical protein Ahy_A02g008860 [Arachis hypogaea]